MDAPRAARRFAFALIGVGLLGAPPPARAGDEPESPIRIEQPAEGALLGSRKVHVVGRLETSGDPTGILTINGEQTKVVDRRFEADLQTLDGRFSIEVVYGEVGFPATTEVRRVEVDTVPPVLEIETPRTEVTHVSGNVATIRGWVDDAHLSAIVWNGREVKVPKEEMRKTEWSFAAPFVVPAGGEVRVEIEALDAAGNRSAKVVRVLRASAPPPVVAEAGVLRIRISSSGALALLPPSGSPLLELGTLSSADPAAQQRVLETLRKLLAEWTREPSTREPDGTSRLVLEVAAEPGAPWRHAQWVLQAAADPKVKIYRVRFVIPGEKGEPIAQALPKDRGIESGDAVEVPHVAVLLFRLNEEDPLQARTKIKILNAEWILPKGRPGDVAANAELRAARADVFARIAALVTEFRAAEPGLRAEIETPPPKGGAVPYEDVSGVMQALRAAGIVDVRFGGSPPPGDLIGIGGGAGGAFKGRGASRQPSGEPPGGQSAGDAVNDALRWLAAHQSADGSWESAGWNKWCDGKPVRADLTGLGKPPYDVGVTGLALLAFLGAGYTNRGDHPFAKVVSNGFRYLKNVQDPEGCVGPRTSGHYIYNHAIAALALVEAYGMTGSSIYKGPAQAALDFIALSRNPYFAWRYGVRPGDNDTSVTGWMMMALKSAQLINASDVVAGKRASLVVDEDAWDGIRAWIDKMTDPETGRVGYQQRGTGPARPTELIDRFPAERSEAMTAVGMLTRIFRGQHARMPEIVKGANLCVRLLPTWNPNDGSIDMYYWYYATLAMFQVGGPHWSAWNEAMKSAFVDSQKRDGDYCAYRGSWDPIDPWGPDGGRVYATAMMALCLEVYYRYDKVFGANDK